MSSESDKAGGSSAKTPTKPDTKRASQGDAPGSASNVVASTATAAVAPATTTGVSSSAFCADVDPSLIVDYNESTPLPLPQSGDEDSVLMGYDIVCLTAVASRTAIFTIAH